jgi:DNA-binding NarL/FixJ family response regulator
VIPYVVVEGPAIALEFAAQEATAAGWTVEPGFDGPHRSGHVVRSGVVAGTADAEAALLAALAGEGLVVQATAPREVIDRLVDDLRRLGPVDHRVGQPERPRIVEPEARAILGLLAEGHSLGEAAAILGLSRRTADRRLAEGRRTLGVERTTEAIARARRLGWLGGGRVDRG